MIWAAHLVAAVLALTDLAARAARIRWLMRALQVSLPWRDAIRLNAWADLATALTPMRLGGEPARFAAMRSFRIPLTSTVAGLGLEVVVATPVTVMLGLLMAWRFGPAWLESAGDGYGRGLLWLLAGMALLGIVLGAWWRRQHPVDAAIGAGMPRPTVATAGLIAGTTLISVLCRAAILPVLTWSAPVAADRGALLLESFGLLFGQMLIPIPAGTGVVDAAFLQGAAGDSGVATLFAWRAYTTGVGAVLGAVLLLRVLARSPGGIRASLRRLGPAGRVARDRGVVSQQAVQHRAPLARHGGGSSPLGQSAPEAPVGE